MNYRGLDWIHHQKFIVGVPIIMKQIVFESGPAPSAWAESNKTLVEW